MLRRIPVAALLGILAIIFASSMALAGTVTLSDRQTEKGTELVQIDDVTNVVSVFRDGALVEQRPATKREIEALGRIQQNEAKQTAIDDLRSSVADIKGRPVGDVNARLDRLEQAFLELAAATGVE